MAYGDPRPDMRPDLERIVAPATRIITPRPHSDVQDIGFRTTNIVVSSAVDTLLFSNVSGACVWVRNFTVGGSAIFLLDSTFTANGVLVASNGGAIWNQAAPGAAEVRIFISGTSVYARAGATRHGNALWASCLNTFGPA